MTLKELGHRYYISPDKKDSKWMTPVLRAHSYPDWIDATDWSDEQLIDWLTT